MKKSTYLLTLLLTALLCLPWGSNAWAAQSLPYSYGFEDYDLSADGWTKYFGTSLADNNNECAIVGAAKKTGSYGFRFSSYNTSGANAQYLISPELDTPNGVYVSFWYKASSANGTEKFKVGYSTSGTDISDFEFGDEISYNNSTTWKEYTHTFPIGTKYIAVYYYANYQYRLYVDDFSFTSAGLAPAEGPDLSVKDGSKTISSEYNYNFRLAIAGTTHIFTLSNPGTEATPVAVSHTGNFGAELSATSIPAGGEVTLTVTMPATTGSDVITVSSTADGIEDFVLNVSGTARDASKFYETLLGGALPQDWTTSGTWTWSTTNGAATSAWYETDNRRLVTPLLIVAEDETFYFDAKGTYDGWQGIKFEYSADGTTWTASATTTTLSSDWQTFMINDIPAGKYYIALHGWQVNIRNFYGGMLPAKPQDLTLESKTSNSLTLDWTPAASETAWILQYSADGTNWSSDVAVNAKPFELSGLNAGAKYYVRVKANVADSEWSNVASFVTECGAITATSWPYNFNDDETNGYPVCWDRITNYDSFDGVYYPIVTTSSAYDGKSLMFYGGGSTTALSATLPPFSTPIKDLVLSFSYKSSVSGYSQYGKLVVGYMTDPADANTFVEVETLDQSASYIEAGPIAFASAPDNARITIRYANGTSDYGSAYVDNLVIEEAPSCMKPGKPAAATASLTANSAVVTWTAGGSESAWKLQYKAEGGDWSEEIAVDAASYTLTSLTATTTYYVRVRAVCSSVEISDWSSEGEFTTPCGVSAMPFEEYFSSSSVLPDCWERSAAGTYSWSPYSEYVSGGYNYYIRLRGSSSSYTLSTPSINLSEDAVLKFNWKNGSSTKINANVYISTNGGVTKTLLPNDLSTKVTSWTGKTIDLSDYTGETVILYFVSSTGNSTSSYAYLDDVQVIVKPCEALAAPTAAPTIDGGTISWTGNAKALRYQAVGASTWNTVAVTGTSYLLTGLEASTSYNVQVQVECATGDDDLWSNSLTFTTRCAATDELPYSNNFDAEESEEMPACWSKISATDYPYVYSGAAAYGGSGKALYFYGSAEQIAVLPALTADLSTLTFSLYYKGGSANFQLGYVKADGVTFVTLATLPALTAFGAEPYELDLASIPAEAKYLAIRYTNSSNYATGFVDNVVVKKTPTCFKPASIAASAITANSATVAWTASGKGETQYEYVYVLAGETPDWAVATMTDELSATLTTLAPTTEYDFYVRSYCDTEDQSDAVKASFTTKCAAAALPFDEDFDAVADYDMPECWNVYAATYYSAYVANGLLRADAPKTNATVIVLPELEASFVGASVAFDYSTSNGTLQVGYVTDAEDKNSFVAVSEALTAASTTQVLVPFTAGSGNIAFRFIGNTGDGDLYLDNIRVSNTLVLANDADNSDALAANNGQTLDIQINRTFYADGYFNTVCLPFSLPTLDGTPLEGGELLAFKYGYVENGELLLRVYPTDAIEAGVPYLISWTAGENIVNPIFTSVTIAASAGKSVGENNDVQFVGIFAPETFQKDDKTKLFMLANNQIAWSGVEESGHSLKSFRAYFQTITEVGGGANNAPIRHGMPARIVMGEQIATGCENIQGGQVQSLKVLENNQVVIIRNGVKYNLQGQKIQ